MGIIEALTLALVLVGPVERVALRESAAVDDWTTATIGLKAEGTFQPATLPGAPEAKPLALKVGTQLLFNDQVAAVDRQGVPTRSARFVAKAAAAINGEVRESESQIRPEVMSLMAVRREAAVVVASPGGPLSRSELELVQVPGDPLALPSLLPSGPVAVGDHWTVGELAARNLSGYDALASNALEATLEAFGTDSARVRLLGTIRGATLGGEGSMACDGSFTFDRKANRVDRLTLRRAEARRAGPIEAGLDVKSVLTVVRTDNPGAPKTAELAKMPARTAELDAARLMLLFRSPDGKYELLHDRDWHLFWDDARQVVLKRLARGEMVAQCNLAVGPNAGKGRHQDLGQFREDIRKGLGPRFVRFAGDGEVDGAPKGGFRYKLSVQGKQGDAGVLWHYYLIAGPDGDQLIATFTLGLSQQAQFGDEDLRLIGSLEWK